MPSKSKRARKMPVKNASRPLVYWSIIGFVIKIISKFFEMIGCFKPF